MFRAIMCYFIRRKINRLFAKDDPCHPAKMLQHALTQIENLHESYVCIAMVRIEQNCMLNGYHMQTVAKATELARNYLYQYRDRQVPSYSVDLGWFSSRAKRIRALKQAIEDLNANSYSHSIDKAS